MTLLKIETEKTAKGTVKAVFDRFAEAIGTVPETLQLMSASPGLFERHMGVNLYFREHPGLSFPLQCLIRYLTAAACDNGVCVRINASLLKRQGMSAEELDRVREDVSTAPLEERERALLSFVTRVISRPDSATGEDVERLRRHGWSDADILDAVYHGVMMVSSELLTRIFKMATPV
jgi:alkylhydroperoxidase family enzyme